MLIGLRGSCSDCIRNDHDVTDSVAAAQSFDVLATPAEQQFL